MDIKKEREAFEKHASKFFITNEAFEDDGENYVYDEVKFMWDCWLAAKAQAVPEGFVVFPKKQTSKMRSLARDFDARLSLTKYEQLHNIWVKRAIIESQEQ